MNFEDFLGQTYACVIDIGPDHVPSNLSLFTLLTLLNNDENMIRPIGRYLPADLNEFIDYVVCTYVFCFVCTFHTDKPFKKNFYIHFMIVNLVQG